jgi:hypothetical protein
MHLTNVKFQTPLFEATKQRYSGLRSACQPVFKAGPLCLSFPLQALGEEGLLQRHLSLEKGHIGLPPLSKERSVPASNRRTPFNPV